MNLDTKSIKEIEHIKKTLQHPKAKEEERLEFQDKIKRYKGKVIVYKSGFIASALRTDGYEGMRCYRMHDWHPSKRVIGT
ncbi:putative transposase [Orientia chuto str. Dubai]|uniref:Putative transposase n=1 Tax=Orientia chuto str. Dubai TaxID=1359168 RepID=A0A0F3MK64_9RICK|nr:hypothetical protein [Candidatus Orientia mediorientalis]KJV55862.1 putative transposase [Orientia chuto str. Dubai]